MNSALMIAPPLSSLLLGIWDVSKEALERGELDGLVRCVWSGAPEWCFP